MNTTIFNLKVEHDKEQLSSEIEAYVLIEREGKQYVVPVRMKMDAPTIGFLDAFIEKVEQVTKNWKVKNEDENVETNYKGKVIGEIPYEDFKKGVR